MNSIIDINSMKFKNSKLAKLGIDEVLDKVLEFIKEQPHAEYEFSIGTDAQAFSDHTCFASSICIRRIGYGAWFAASRNNIDRPIKILREKISIETITTYELYDYTLNTFKFIEKVTKINPHIDLQAHLDVGNFGPTKDLKKEMTSYFYGTQITPIIKPYSYCASTISDKFSK